MKLRRFIYIAAIILITFQINKHITYSFEVQEKARTRSTVQIGKGAGSYSLPATAGNPGEALWIDANGDLSWKSIFPMPELAFSDPFLITEADCNDKPESNKFLPLNPYYKPTRGYCLATVDGTWDGILKYQDKNGVIHEGGIIAHDMGRYCDVYYEQAYDLPSEFVMHLHTATTSKLALDRYWNKFEQSEQETILTFVEVVRAKKIYFKQVNYYHTAALDLTMFILGGFRPSSQTLQDLPDANEIQAPYGSVGLTWEEIIKDEDNNTIDIITHIEKPAYHTQMPPEDYGYGDMWDGRVDFDSMVIGRVNPFCEDAVICPTPETYLYTSLYAMCVR